MEIEQTTQLQMYLNCSAKLAVKEGAALYLYANTNITTYN